MREAALPSLSVNGNTGRCSCHGTLPFDRNSFLATVGCQPPPTDSPELTRATSIFFPRWKFNDSLEKIGLWQPQTHSEHVEQQKATKKEKSSRMVRSVCVDAAASSGSAWGGCNFPGSVLYLKIDFYKKNKNVIKFGSFHPKRFCLCSSNITGVGSAAILRRVAPVMFGAGHKEARFIWMCVRETEAVRRHLLETVDGVRRCRLQFADSSSGAKKRICLICGVTQIRQEEAVGWCETRRGTAFPVLLVICPTGAQLSLKAELASEGVIGTPWNQWLQRVPVMWERRAGLMRESWLD